MNKHVVLQFMTTRGLSGVSKLAAKIWFPAFLLLSLGLARSYYSLRTGFLLPDEAFYILGTQGKHFLRPVFLGLLKAYFWVTGSRDVFAMLATGPLFGVLWSIASIFVVYRIVSCFSEVRDHAAYCSLALALTPIFAVLAPTFLTEAPALFFALLGIWRTLRYLNDRSFRSLMLGALSFSIAAMIREPYSLFLVGNGLVLFVFSVFKRLPYRSSLPFVLGAAIMLKSVPMPVQVPAALQFQQSIFDSAILNACRTLGFSNCDSHYSVGVSAVGSLVIYSPREAMGVLGPLLVPTAIRNFALSMLLGWSPVVAGMVAMGYLWLWLDVFRKRDIMTALLMANVTLALGTLGFLAFALSLAERIYMSFLMRLSHTALPSLMVLFRFFSRAGRKGTSLSAAMFILYLLVFGGTFVTQAQSGLSSTPIDRLNLSYVAPYYRLYLFLKDTNEPVLIFAEPTIRATVFFDQKSNVAIKGIVNQTEFVRTVQGNAWAMVLIYGELYPEHFLTLREHASFYEQLLRNQTSYPVHTIWWDTESYLLAVSFKDSQACRAAGEGIGAGYLNPCIRFSLASLLEHDLRDEH